MSYLDNDDFGYDDFDYEVDDWDIPGDDEPDEDMDELGPEDDEHLIDGVGFADPGGNSALRAATRNNPCNLPCPTCGRKNMLTPADVARHYQCDRCADRAERGW